MNFVYISNPLHFYKLQKNADFLLSISGSAINKFGMFWFLAPLFLRIPIISVASGSDLSELIISKSRLSCIYRKILKKSKGVFTPPYPRIVENLERLQIIKNVYYLKYPMLLAVPTEKTHKLGPIRILHATNLDWGIRDNSPTRNSTKGNDRFIKGLLMALESGANLQCDIAYRGPDRVVARDWIENSDFRDKFNWFDEVDQHELQQLIANADIVVDQFDVGGFGLIALEAMSQETAVLLHLDRKYLESQYGNIRIPVINVREPEQIADFFLSTNKEELLQLGQKAKEWVWRNHSMSSENYQELLTLLKNER
jgi:glycosyltransferase involved in cell wall biosynthesis